ncbi:hypothetical protein [Achromobacter aegrifaciens]|uniref:hypothetical protein n=1 Tax=Achromobacter aegrifaciens TaxID=1287736 RepID=UPI000F747D47|nr:hypothetical protein [Achromobacter aegrifaciens]RSF08826.1 hypothetical protein EGU54_02260 [Achromobacter aegrifaciens]
MTNRYTQIDPHDALYISVTKTPGGVEELAAFLTNRRGISIHFETLRQKMTRKKGQSMSLDLFELSTEWMMEKQDGERHARDWLMALNVRHGVAASILPPAPHHPDEVGAVRTKVMEMSSLNGRLAAVAIEAVSDGDISDDDASDIMVECDKIIEKAQRLKRNVVRAAQDKARAAC